jgi:hypothetical protein
MNYDLEQFVFYSGKRSIAIILFSIGIPGVPSQKNGMRDTRFNFDSGRMAAEY